jgi:hypothetical protein
VEKRFIDIFLERIPQVSIKQEIVIELKYIKKENADKWLDKEGKIVDAPTPVKPVKIPKAGAKPRKTKVVPPPAPLPVPVKPLLDDVIEKATIQLSEYMQLKRFQRGDVLGFALVYVGNECRKILQAPLEKA